MVAIRPLVGVEIGTGKCDGNTQTGKMEGMASKPGIRDIVVFNNPVYRMASQIVLPVDLPRG